jgi:hypothetical protein
MDSSTQQQLTAQIGPLHNIITVNIWADAQTCITQVGPAFWSMWTHLSQFQDQLGPAVVAYIDLPTIYNSVFGEMGQHSDTHQTGGPSLGGMYRHIGHNIMVSLAQQLLLTQIGPPHIIMYLDRWADPQTHIRQVGPAWVEWMHTSATISWSAQLSSCFLHRSAHHIFAQIGRLSQTHQTGGPSLGGMDAHIGHNIVVSSAQQLWLTQIGPPHITVYLHR